MKLQVNDAVVVGPSNARGELFVVGDRGASAGVRTSRGGVVVSADDFNPERIQLDDVLADTPDVHVGDQLPGATVGVLSYDFGNFELYPLTAPARTPGPIARETTVEPRGGELAVATFNVENLDPSDTATIPRLAELVVDNLQAPDLIAIEEMQDNNGESNEGTSAANLSWEALIAAIVAAERPALPVPPDRPGEERGRRGARRQHPRRVPVPHRPRAELRRPRRRRRHDGHRRLQSQGKTHLTLSPGRVDPANPAWNASRKPLAGEFTWKGRTLFAIANHSPRRAATTRCSGAGSRRSGHRGPATRAGRRGERVRGADPGRGQEGVHRRARRHQRLRVLRDDGDPRGRRRAGQPAARAAEAERYSYVFEGNSQVLDQILASGGALARCAASTSSTSTPSSSTRRATTTHRSPGSS